VGRAVPHLGVGQARENHPISPIVVHSATGRAFLGVRTRLDGTLEIVFDQFGVRRSIWEVIHGSVGFDGLQEACARAINADDCLATLHAALSSAGIRIECKEDRFGGSMR
jgi:hypothetical protein